MLFIGLLSLVFNLPSASFALPTSRDNCDGGTIFKSSVVEKLNQPPAGWEMQDGANVDKSALGIKLRIHLVQQNMEKLHDITMKIATPGDSRYGRHLSQEAINAIVSPRDESRDLVMQWIKSVGLGDYATVSPLSDSVIVEASVNQIEKLLNAEYNAFVESKTGSFVFRTLEYSLPDILKGHVDMVQPTTFFGLRAMRSTISKVHAPADSRLGLEETSAVTGCTDGSITPLCLSNLYNFASSTSSQSAGKIGIAGFLEQYPSTKDLSSFLSANAVQGNAGQSYTCTLINGGTCPSSGSAGTEANLDTQYVRAITKKIPNVFYSVGGRPPAIGVNPNTNEPYLEFLNYLLQLPNSTLPNTISISYGDDQDSVPIDYARNVCNLFAQLGARGVSVLVSSGDSGVGDTCTSNGIKTFTTSFPASCPWVTTVGGTDGIGPEGAWTGSGGGFSDVFPRPAYQNASVSNWLSTDETHTNLNQYFNSSGRAYPDVSAQSTNFVVVIDGLNQLVDGTSASCPTFASIIQLLNSDRIAAGKAPLGFLNPWLYGPAISALTDITTGANIGCGGNIDNAGFEAVAGWDPATGLGTPDYASLLAVSRAT